MNRRFINFQGNIDLDQKIVDQLESYLEERESHLANQIANIWKPASSDVSPSSPTLNLKTLKLGEAIDGFCRKLRTINEEELKSEVFRKDWKEGNVVQEMNKALWEFAEVLEGCVTELFQQVHSIPIDRWQLSFLTTVQSIRDLLTHRIEDLIWVIRRLEKPIKEFSKKFLKMKKTPLTRLRGLWAKYIDPNLVNHLENSESLLKSHFDRFNNCYHEYLYLSGKVEDYMGSTKSFHILALLDHSDQDLFIHLIRLLKLLEFNQRPKKEVGVETVRAIKNLASVDNVIRLLALYLSELTNAFFHCSLEWKSLNQDKEHFDEALDKLKVKVNEDLNELTELLNVMSQYRRFMLKNDPNPYVSSRWGFSEWLVGPEPLKAKKILHLIYKGETLKRDFQSFIPSLNKEDPSKESLYLEQESEIEQILHEMGQPLISKTMIKNRAEKLLEKLKDYDEIGNPRMDAILFVEHVFSIAMREDWKYHVLHEFPLFHHLYHLHLGVAEHSDDSAHRARMERFRHLINQIEAWIAKEDIYAHVHEIQIDISDLKTYLQDFLATVQRAGKDKSNDPFFDDKLHKYHQQLLEYRYLFGGFFSMIEKENQDGRDLRNQFLFVDQYFESLENLIFELKSSWEGRS